MDPLEVKQTMCILSSIYFVGALLETAFFTFKQTSKGKRLKVEKSLSCYSVCICHSLVVAECATGHYYLSAMFRNFMIYKPYSRQRSRYYLAHGFQSLQQYNRGRCQLQFAVACILLYCVVCQKQMGVYGRCLQNRLQMMRGKNEKKMEEKKKNMRKIKKT